MCLQALRDWLRRWGVFAATAACIAGVGAPAFAAWSVLPLAWSLDRPVWGVVTPVTYAALVALVPWALRSWLWPAEWAEMERSLPIPPARILVSDLEMIALALLPAALLLAAGAGLVLWHNEPRSGVDAARLVAVLLAALSGSVLLSTGMLQALRRAARAGGPWRARALWTHPTAPSGVARCSAFRATVWLPLLRSPRRQAVHAAALGFGGLCAIAAVTALAESWARWGLAGFAGWALVTVSRVNTLSRQETASLHAACTALPLEPDRLERARAWMALAPAAAGLAVLGATTAHLDMRPLVWWTFVAASCLCWWIEVRRPVRTPATQAARWLLFLATTIALASETLA